jgi:hypothetical protein
MATPSQIAANRENSKKSSGPKTPEGKAKSCLNHLSHGFTSNTARLIPGENEEELKALLADLMDEYQPATPTEQILVEKMCQNQWLSGRAFRLQSDAFTTGGRGGYFAVKLTITKDLGVLIRYQTSAERAFHQAHKELVTAQKQRAKAEIDFESQNVVEAAAAAPPQAKTEPKTAPITRVETDFPAQPAASAAPDALFVAPIAPDASESIKKAA